MNRLFKALPLAMAIVMISCTGIAEDIDLSKMTGAELAALRDRIDAEIAENHYVGWSDESEIEDGMEDFIAETYNVKSYSVKISSLKISNDWGLYRATADYSFRDDDYNKHSGSVVSEYIRQDYDLVQIYLEVDGIVIIDERDSASSDSESSDSDNSQTVKDLQHGELVSVTINEMDSIIVIKAKISPSFSNNATINQNYYNIEYLIKKYGVDKYKELQYWAVADMTSGTEAKVISFDVSQSVMQKLKNNEIAANQLGNYVKNLWLHQSLR